MEGEGVQLGQNCTAYERKGKINNRHFSAWLNMFSISGDKTKELPYVEMLNSNLPDDIRVLAWAPVGPDFSARFNCLQRTYKYFFPRGNINIEVNQ